MGDAERHHATRRALNGALFERLTAERGATSGLARARLLGIGRHTLWRMRRRPPSMEVATRMADILGTTLDELFPVVELVIPVEANTTYEVTFGGER